MLGMGELLLIRHGETAWSRTGQYGGRTDLPLSDAGVAAGRALRPLLAGRHVVAAFTSPLARARDTAALLACLRSYPAQEMEAFPVSHLVSYVQNDEPALIQPVE